MSLVNKQQLAIKQMLSRTEGNIYEQINTILDSNGTIDDVQDYCKLLEHSVKTVRTQIAQDEQIIKIGDDIKCANFATDNREYGTCVELLLVCLQLTPNPMYRDDLRLRYYADILDPKADVDYNIMRISLENTVIKLNGGKPLSNDTEATVEKKSWKRWFPTFTTA